MEENQLSAKKSLFPPAGKTWKYLVYCKEELDRDRELLWDISRLFCSLSGHGIRHVALSGVPRTGMKKVLQTQGIRPEESLLLTGSDAILEQIKDLPLASVAFKSRKEEGQELFGADYLVEGFEEVDFYFLERVYQRKHGIPWRVIDTQRCYLREMTVEDLPALVRLYEGEGVTDYMEPLYEWERGVEYARAYIENMYPYYGYGMWLVKDRRTHQLMGRAGLNLRMAGHEKLLEMGYMIGAEYQGKGYGTEVCQGILDYIRKEELGFDRVYCFVDKRNRASIALLGRLGFSLEEDSVITPHFADSNKNQAQAGREMLIFCLELPAASFGPAGGRGNS